MSEAAKPQLDVEGSAAPPRRNGELVFQEPWEGRAFGLAVALGDQGAYQWEAFRSRLIAVIAEADCPPKDSAAASAAQKSGGAQKSDAPQRSEYYDRWLTALQRLLVESGVLTPAEIEKRVREFATGERDIVNPGG